METDAAQEPPVVETRGMTMGYGERIVLQDVDFAVRRGDVFVIMGGSGSGKSTLLRHLIGLRAPLRGKVLFGDTDFWAVGEAQRREIQSGFGVLYQQGALWSSMTVAENLGLLLQQYTAYSADEVREVVSYKLALVGLAGYEHYYPAQLSGGMRKRAGLARALALDPQLLFLDEPGSGLDPLSAKLLDDLILHLRDGLGATVVIVTHELASIFAIGTNGVFIDAESRTITARGNPRELAQATTDPKLRAFLSRGTSKADPVETS